MLSCETYCERNQGFIGFLLIFGLKSNYYFIGFGALGSLS